MKLYKTFLTENECYKKGKTIKVSGVMVHSTGANNPNLRRYVQPDDGKLGENTAKNDWNQLRPGGSQVCVHAFIGKLADGTVATYQTLPWNMRGWHCGKSGNDTHIGFEICEDALEDSTYFRQVYQEAVELTAYLCKMYNLDPAKKGVVLCHSEGYDQGIASNHSDVMHWFPKHGKNMDDFRQDVLREMTGIPVSTPDTGEQGDDEMTYEQFKAWINQYQNELAQMEASDWAKTELEEAVTLGLSDGKRPKSLVTREEAIALAVRAAKQK